MEEIRKHLVFTGRVQGVGFRYKAAHIARSLRLTGWVHNEWDGSVTMEVQGKEEWINRLLYELNCDRYIRIDQMDASRIPVKTEKGFSIR